MLKGFLEPISGEGLKNGSPARVISCHAAQSSLRFNPKGDDGLARSLSDDRGRHGARYLDLANQGSEPRRRARSLRSKIKRPLTRGKYLTVKKMSYA